MISWLALGRPSSLPSARRGIGQTLSYVSLLTYLSVALLSRALLIGKPAFHHDEEFYLLVGQRMAQGALPYVDIWDRKPWGLFAIYRSVFLLPFDPVLTYQALGLACSVVTALVIERIARLIAPPAAARLAGVLYLLWGCIFNIALGQAPVFFNLLVALAALIVIDTQLRARCSQLVMQGAGAMLLLGLAIQIKYTVIFEGFGLGLMLLHRAWSAGYTAQRLLLTAGAWVGVALLPTALVTLYYVQLGQAEPYIFANFVSVFARTTSDGAFGRLLGECAVLTPFFLAILVAPRQLTSVRGTDPAALPWIRLWAIASVVGFLVFGTWYDHYVSPMLVPFSVLAAPCLARAARHEQWYGWLLLGAGACGALGVTFHQVRKTGTAEEFSQAASAVARELHGRCLYVYQGDAALYRTTQACTLTRFVFHSHLSKQKEAEALGVDPVQEVSRILTAQPGVIVTDHKVSRKSVNTATYNVLREQLGRAYERYAVVALGKRRYDLWRLNDNPRRDSAGTQASLER